ncbi:uncharacterized protein TNCV_1880181 [Trichonephila clavipes]|nr:uncharacterized protein TNCV_1880181 [Trichonephila clavipes]
MKKKGVGPMTAQDLEKMIQNFEETGSFHAQSGRARKRVNSTVVEVATTVQDKLSGGLQQCSTREIVRTLGRPVTTVHKILRNILHCYSYKIKYVQELLPSDLPTRDFALEFRAHTEVDNEWPWKILFSDEAHFHLT